MTKVLMSQGSDRDYSLNELSRIIADMPQELKIACILEDK